MTITYPTGVFNFPVGNNNASAFVHLGSVPLSDTAHSGTSTGGPSDWTLQANVPSDGTLIITLAAKTGDNILTDSPAAGGSLFTIDFPVANTFNPASTASETITILGGVSNTQITAPNGLYSLNPAAPYTAPLPSIQPPSSRRPLPHRKAT